MAPNEPAHLRERAYAQAVALRFPPFSRVRHRPASTRRSACGTSENTQQKPAHPVLIPIRFAARTTSIGCRLCAINQLLRFERRISDRLAGRAPVSPRTRGLETGADEA